MCVMDEDLVRKQLVEDNAYFKRVLDLIPTQFYFSEETRKKLRGEEIESPLDVVDSGPPNQKKARKSENVVDPAERLARKRKKFDPSQNHTVTQLQSQLIEEEKQEKGKKSKKAKKPDSKELQHGESHDVLKEKLHNKISKLRAKRKALDSKDAWEKKRLKRRESKLKLKMRRKAEKQAMNSTREALVNGSRPAGMKSPPHKPIYNNDGKMVFSKFDLADSSTGGGSTEKKSRKSKDALTGKNYRALLHKVSKQQEKIEELKKTDKSKAISVKEKIAWKKQLQKAEGIKVKDDPVLLKKSLKNKERKKKQSARKWEKKKAEAETQAQEKQKKRETNIKKRKKQHSDKKMKKMKKKGHILPGF